MFYPPNWYSLKCIARETTAKYLREAEIDRLVRESSPRRQSWLSHQVRKGLHNLSHPFVMLGQRLDHIETNSV